MIETVKVVTPVTKGNDLGFKTINKCDMTKDDVVFNPDKKTEVVTIEDVGEPELVIMSKEPVKVVATKNTAKKKADKAK